MPQFDYRLTVAAAPLHTSTKAPIIELGRESHVTLVGPVIDQFHGKGPEAAKELFLAEIMQGAEMLWDREIRAQWFPAPRPTPSTPTSPASPPA